MRSANICASPGRWFPLKPYVEAIMRTPLELLVAGSLGLLVVCTSSLADDNGTPPMFSEIMRGRYLVEAGDCTACHTAQGGQPFAGGRPIPTPFGTIYAANITPDEETGIGKWSAEDFWRAMHDGQSVKRGRLYPAMPYPWYTRLDHDDVLAIKAYLDTLRPVRNDVKPPELPWPMSWRPVSLWAWDTMFFHPGVFRRDPQKSEEWNRGAYLVEGAGHCAACHSPKNFLGAVKGSRRLEGGMGEGWFASSLRPTMGEGIGAWSIDDIVQYLKTGANERTRAMGAMKDVVEKSTSRMNDGDLHAMAVYLKDLPGGNAQANPQKASNDRDVLDRGRLVYVDRCEGCHMEKGDGLKGVFPPLAGNTALHADDPTSLARIVLEGADSARTSNSVEGFAMPGFADTLSDADIAAVLTYVRASYGNRASAVSPGKVASVRKELQRNVSAR
jgi:mono/diheme cytochrome c family protein